MKRREDLSAPRRPGRSFGIHYDPEAFGQFSEAIARFIGTARFLVWQTMFIVLWLFVNKFVRAFDGKQLQLLTLLLSLQAAYAAPLILLAQNRTESRDSLLPSGIGLSPSGPRPIRNIWHVNWRVCGWPCPTW
jgi:Protein of unknown function (DUF1003)